MVKKLVFFVTFVVLLSKVFASASIQEKLLRASGINYCYPDIDMSYISKLLFPEVNAKSHDHPKPKKGSPVSVVEHKKIFNEPKSNEVQICNESGSYQRQSSVWLPVFSDYSQIDDSDYFLLYLPETSDARTVSMPITRENVTVIGDQPKSDDKTVVMMEAPSNEASTRNTTIDKPVIALSIDIDPNGMGKSYSEIFPGESPDYYYC